MNFFQRLFESAELTELRIISRTEVVNISSTPQVFGMPGSVKVTIRHFGGRIPSANGRARNLKEAAAIAILDWHRQIKALNPDPVTSVAGGLSADRSAIDSAADQLPASGELRREATDVL